MADLTTIILTYNEELNISGCIKSVESISQRIVIIDSYSTDNTVEIAKRLGAEVYQNEFVNHSKQFNYGLKVANIKTTWILRLDADERLTLDSSEEISKVCSNNMNSDINGVILRFEVNFLGKKLKHGGVYPLKVLRLYKNGKGYMENLSMDERFILSSGTTYTMKHDALHQDFKSLEKWVQKHNLYSTREVEVYLERKLITDYTNNLDKSAKLKRFLKFNIYYKLPLGLRPFLYFIYRYFIKFGFLDGKEGFIYAILQAFWYRFLVDSKIHEYNKLKRT